MKLINQFDINIDNLILSKRTLPSQQTENLTIIYSNGNSDVLKNNLEITVPFAISKVKSCQIESACILDKNDNKEIIEMDIKNEETIEFLPGDTIGILPENDMEEVEFMLNALELSEKANLRCIVQVDPNSNKKGVKVPPHIPVTGTTCRELLEKHLNFKTIPKKNFLCTLASYCREEREKEFLESLSCREGSDLYNEHVLNKKMNVLDCFKICHSLHPPLSLLIQYLPRLLPRPYSISNVYMTEQNVIRIIFSYLLENSGIATKYLKKKMEYLTSDDSNAKTLNIYFRQPNKFRLVEEYYTKNFIMISIGCGISPFLAFLKHKKFLMDLGVEMGLWYLYSGFKCQSSAIYRNEIINYEKDGVLEKCYECFSKSSSKYKYVQDAIEQNQDEFVSLVQNQNTIIFVCADGNTISKDIRECIQKCVFGTVDDDSNKFLQEWIKSNRYIEDIWL